MKKCDDFVCSFGGLVVRISVSREMSSFRRSRTVAKRVAVLQVYHRLNPVKKYSSPWEWTTSKNLSPPSFFSSAVLPFAVRFSFTISTKTISFDHYSFTLIRRNQNADIQTGT